MKITLAVVGKSLAADAAWGAEYVKRFRGSLTIKEVSAPKNLPAAETQRVEADRLLKILPPKALIVVLDERGKDMSSRDFAARLQTWQDRGAGELFFVIGGADGVTDEVRARAELLLGFGRLTWPHRLVRVMLLEQIYRAQQINAGHPYHRD